MRLLVVDDSVELLDLLVRTFASEGHELRTASSLAEARRALVGFAPEVVVLDVELPDGSGVELCRELREKEEHCPVLLLTAHSAVHERVAGLDAGADDFLPKPFAVAELRARVRALGRRGPIERPAALAVAGVALDLASRRAFAGEREVAVTAREWALLELLLSRRGRVVAREAILDIVWGDASEGASASLDVIMGRIRRKLGGQLIRTVRGEGYVIDGE